MWGFWGPRPGPEARTYQEKFRVSFPELIPEVKKSTSKKISWEKLGPAPIITMCAHVQEHGMKITPRQLRQIIREELTNEQHMVADAMIIESPSITPSEPQAAWNPAEHEPGTIDEDGEEWERRGEWPVVREPGSPPPSTRRERERARTSTRPTPTSRPIVDPRTVGAAYVSGPAPGEPFDPGRHRGEFPALPEEELEPEEESEEETLGESSMTLTAVQLKRLIRRKLREICY